MNKRIKVEVAYGVLTRQCIISLEVDAESTIENIIVQSGILTLFPDIDLSTQKTGVFSKPKSLSDSVKEGDRIEIYRPLSIDPKEARRKKC